MRPSFCTVSFTGLLTTRSIHSFITNDGAIRPPPNEFEVFGEFHRDLFILEPWHPRESNFTETAVVYLLLG